MKDQRHRKNGHVHITANKITHNAGTLFGLNYKKVPINGTVLDVKKEKKDGAKRANTMVTVEFALSTTDKRVKTVTRQSITPGWKPRASCPLCPLEPPLLPLPLLVDVPQDMQIDDTTVSAAAPPPAAAAVGTESQPPQQAVTANAPQQPSTSSASSSAQQQSIASASGSLSKLKDGARPVAEAHGKKWYSPDDIDGLKHVKETVEKAWYMDDAHGHHIGPKMPPPATPITHLHAYMLMMPPDQLEIELKLMNANLTSKKKQKTTMGELQIGRASCRERVLR
jgi:hypothetical protein